MLFSRGKNFCGLCRYVDDAFGSLVVWTCRLDQQICSQRNPRGNCQDFGAKEKGRAKKGREDNDEDSNGWSSSARCPCCGEPLVGRSCQEIWHCLNPVCVRNGDGFSVQVKYRVKERG